MEYKPWGMIALRCGLEFLLNGRKIFDAGSLASRSTRSRGSRRTMPRRCSGNPRRRIGGTTTKENAAMDELHRRAFLKYGAATGAGLASTVVPATTGSAAAAETTAITQILGHVDNANIVVYDPG